MGKYAFRLSILIVGGFLAWINFVGWTKSEIQSPDGKFKIRIAEVGFNGGTLVRLSAKNGWPLYKKFFGWAERDGVPFAFEWFPDAVAMIDHFDFGTSLTAVALPSGQPLEFLSKRESEVREALRWKYNFTDYRKMILEKKDAITGSVIRVYANNPSEGRLNNKPVWFSDFVVLFKFSDSNPREESLLSAIALNALGKSCDNPNNYRSAKASFENQVFHAIRFSCYRQRAE